jgi:hypothetical protein
VVFGAVDVVLVTEDTVNELWSTAVVIEMVEWGWFY